MADFDANPESYNVIDVRNRHETAGDLFFNNAILIPLPELRTRLNEIPIDKPLIVHCAGGYRSTAAASIIKSRVHHVPVYDLGEAILEVAKHKA